MTKVEKVLNKLHNQDATIVFRFRSAICYKYKDIREHLTNSKLFTPTFWVKLEVKIFSPLFIGPNPIFLSLFIGPFKAFQGILRSFEAI